MKILSDAHISERRQRFAREAAIFKTLSIEGVPRLISTNALNGQYDVNERLYICNDYIPGPSLDEMRVEQCSADDIITGTIRLANIVHDLHNAGIVHRDIKPQNIIVREGRLQDICLIDFGIAFSSVALDDVRTETGQELGNRFLRLPELHAGSRVKQDPISDVTFVVGILFYLASGASPRSLIDAAGSMPHQRPEILNTRLNSDTSFRMLRPIFDKGFRHHVEERFASIADLKEALMRPADVLLSATSSFDEVLASLNDPGERRMQQRRNHRDLFISTAETLGTRIGHQLNGKYVRVQTGHQTTVEAASTHVGFAPSDDHSNTEMVIFEAGIVGSEIVGTANGVEILRVNADLPNWGATLAPVIQTALERAVSSLHVRMKARPL